MKFQNFNKENGQMDEKSKEQIEEDKLIGGGK